MSIDVRLPSYGMGMSEAEVAEWLVPDGAQVATGDELVEVETEKSTVIVPSPADGTLRIIAPAGEVVAVGGLLAQIEAG
jgi:pyruvate/2-oxoglutarate dehydrogenase complex dihydrolipoamide acyltransferase (E2) component